MKPEEVLALKAEKKATQRVIDAVLQVSTNGITDEIVENQQQLLAAIEGLSSLLQTAIKLSEVAATREFPEIPNFPEIPPFPETQKVDLSQVINDIKVLSSKIEEIEFDVVMPESKSWNFEITRDRNNLIKNVKAT
jgi:hypothetical protein